MSKRITFSLPKGERRLVSQISSKQESPYAAVEESRRIWKFSLAEGESSFHNFAISQILPIHNETGVRSLPQIESMRTSIGESKHILETDDLPNVKLVVVEDELLLFDGHHTLLAYYLSGKKLLAEIPFLIIESEVGESVQLREIAYFFPEFAREEIEKNWKKYTVNWEAEGTNQLEWRRVSSIAELARLLSKGNESPEKK